MLSLVPGYPAVMAALEDAEPVILYQNLYGGAAGLVRGKAKGLMFLCWTHLICSTAPAILISALMAKTGPTMASALPPFLARHLILAKAKSKALRPTFCTCMIGKQLLQPPMCAMPAVTRANQKPCSPFITSPFKAHFGAQLFGDLGLPAHAYAVDGVEYYGGISFLKGGLACADAISTVSPTYAHEITTPEFGMGLDGLLRQRRGALTGIVNGIDTDVWNPETDKDIAQTYTAKTLDKRIANKRALETQSGP